MTGTNEGRHNIFVTKGVESPTKNFLLALSLKLSWYGLLQVREPPRHLLTPGQSHVLIRCRFCCADICNAAPRLWQTHGKAYHVGGEDELLGCGLLLVSSPWPGLLVSI